MSCFLTPDPLIAVEGSVRLTLYRECATANLHPVLALSSGPAEPPPGPIGYRPLEVSALELPTTPRAVRNLLGVGFARFQIVEIHPLVCASDPPELSPETFNAQ